MSGQTRPPLANGPGHRELALHGAVPLIAHLAVGLAPPSPGDEVRVVFDAALSAVLPPSAPGAVASPADPANSTAGPAGRLSGAGQTS